MKGKRSVHDWQFAVFMGFWLLVSLGAAIALVLA